MWDQQNTTGACRLPACDNPSLTQIQTVQLHRALLQKQDALTPGFPRS